MSTPPAPLLRRIHRTRLMQLWRSAGWPCRDAVEVDLLAWGLVSLQCSHTGHETLSLTSTGLTCLAEARQGNVRAQSRHDRLADRVARELLAAGRVVWRELTLRAPVDLPADPSDAAPAAFVLNEAPPVGLWGPGELTEAPAATRPAAWRLARMDVFSVRHTTVEAYLQPAVHEIKVSRADLFSDLRHPTKRQAYEALCSECWYVFPAGMAEPREIPPEWGIWVVHGGEGVDDGRVELVRPARHQPCRLPFPVWMALARSNPFAPEHAEVQPLLADLADLDGQAGKDDEEATHAKRDRARGG